MGWHRRIAAAFLCFGLIAPVALAQAPARRDSHPQRASNRDEGQAGYRSTLRSSRRPYHATYGWRNPGGVGRHEEYYPPGDFSFSGALGQGDPTPVATFQNGEGPPGIREQIAAQQLNVQKYRALQGHIDAYGRPIGFGWGFGLGGFGGFGFR